MEIAVIIFVIGVVFWLNQPSIDKDKLQTMVKSIDKELTKEFQKRDNKVKKLEKRVKQLETQQLRKTNDH